MSTRLHPKDWLAVMFLTAALVSSLFAGVPEGKKEVSGTPVLQSSSAGDMRVERNSKSTSDIRTMSAAVANASIRST